MVVGAVGCGSGQDEPSDPDGRVSPTERNQSRPDRSTAAAQRTCELFAESYLEADATADRGAGDARRRAAAAFGTGDLQKLLNDAPEPRDPTWTDWMARGVRIEVTPVPYVGDEPPESSDTEAFAAVTLQRTAVAADGAREPLPAASILCTLDFGATGWLVDRVDLSLGSP